MRVDTSKWDYRNMWTTQSGELSTRPGADLLFHLGGGTTQAVPHGGFSTKLQFVDSIMHYILITNTATGNLEMHVIDEGLSETKRRQVLVLGKDNPIRDVTYALVNGEIIISGPDFPTLWGYTGSGLIIANKQDSVDVSIQTLSMPNGICTSWNNRCVIAKGEALFVSDPYAPRTFTAGGILTFPGVIYGLHVSSSGSLVASTAAGVYGLSSQASAQGRAIIGSADKLSNYQITGYRRTAMTPFGLYGLTKRGLKRVDIESSEEIELSDKSYVRSLSDMISFPDYREGEIYQTEDGVAVSMGTIDQDSDDIFSGGICMIDMHNKLKSWWTQTGIRRMVGVMKELEGDDLFLMERSISAYPGPILGYTNIYKFHLSHDSDTPDPEYYGSISGVLGVQPELSPVTRAVYAGADNGGALVKVAVRGEYRKKDGSNQEMVTGINGVEIGNPGNDKDNWESTGIPTAKRMKTRELQALRFQFSKRTNDISLEIAVQSGKARVGAVDIATGGYGKKRPV